MEGRKPKIAQQPFTHDVITANKQLDINCRSYIAFNNGTDIVELDGMPILPGMTFSEGATEDGVISYRMNIRFMKAAGKTQQLYIREICDITQK